VIWFFTTIVIVNLFEAYENWKDEEFLSMWANLILAGAAVYCIISPEVF
jgi:hypothetical protein